ncbi:ribokinase [Rhodococcus sp. NPDC058505]|uniref:ribokinase n=1 Tax=Rhodococcus sp. NPDC058505 TaxID=3346531 RepID=UPI00366553EE
MSPRVTVLGSVNIDLVTTTPTRPAGGETVLGTGFTTGPGGKGGNQAIAAARAGARVAFLGAVGTDAFAPQLRDALEAGGVDVTLLREASGPSGVAAITVDAGGENSIVVVPGANAAMEALTDEELDRIAGSDVLLCQLEIPLPTVTAGAANAHAAGVTVFLNPSPAQQLPDALLDNVDVLIVNETEAVQLGDAALARVPHLITTLGGHGARWRGPDGAAVPAAAPAVAVADTTGAGDAFAGTLAACWHLGPATALRRAVAAGALATTRPGAAASSPTAAEVDDLLARHPGPNPARQ